MHHMSQILRNKIDAMMRVFPEKIRNQFSPRVKIPKHWDLDDRHQENIRSFVVQYDEAIASLNEAPTLNLNYMRWLTLSLSVKKRFSVYAYIFVSLFDDFTDMNYIKAIVSIFLDEDRMALNFDKKQIDFLSDMARKSETELKTERLKKLTKDARRAQNAMKELKLGEWGVGLDKSLFQYDKNKYIDVWQEAKQIIEGMEVPDEIYGTYGLDDGENREGFDGDEYYS
jgi:hypothetical protein